MKCPEEKCLCLTACTILGECVMEHNLVKDYADSFRPMVTQVPDGKNRLKKIVRILQAINPSKIHKYCKRNIEGRRKKDIEILQQLGIRYLEPTVYKKSKIKSPKKIIKDKSGDPFNLNPVWR